MGKSKKVFLFLYIVCFFFFPSKLLSQSAKHIVFFSDKHNSSFSVDNPSAFLSLRSIQRRQKQNISIDQRDLPVNANYLDSINGTGAQVLYSSKWLNAAMVLADAAQISAISTYSFVTNTNAATKLASPVSGIKTLQASSLTQSDYATSYSQISLTGTDLMHADGYTGEGKLIAVIDAGFKKADTLKIFDSLFTYSRVISTYDFVDMETDVYDDHYHGTLVLSAMAAYLPGSLIGASWRASYLLLRSEDDASESLSEELNFAKAAEYADSAGADLINCSLGYNTFDNAALNHSYQDMNGNTTIITRAADIAASKGILVVASAGNEGSNSWHKILAPADGDSVLAIGAVNASAYYQGFSSTGPSFDGRIKPDLAAQGAGIVAGNYAGGLTTVNGTSLAAPLVTGLAAGIWQAFPELTCMELYYYLRRSASQYLYPDEYVGYGIPSYSRTKELIEESALDKISVFPNPGDGSRYVINFPVSENEKEVNLQLFDIAGRLVLVKKITASVRIELSNVLTDQAPGMYFVQLIAPDKKYSLKIVKE